MSTSKLSVNDSVIDKDFYPKSSGLTWKGTIDSITRTHVFVKEKIKDGFLVRYTKAQANKYLTVE